jgi:hypothetical protein
MTLQEFQSLGNGKSVRGADRHARDHEETPNSVWATFWWSNRASDTRLKKDMPSALRAASRGTTTP